MAHIPTITPEQLRALRREQELTQQEFAKALSYAPKTVKFWEQQRRPITKAARITILIFAQQVQSRVIRWE